MFNFSHKLFIFHDIFYEHSCDTIDLHGDSKALIFVLLSYFVQKLEETK